LAAGSTARRGARAVARRDAGTEAAAGGAGAGRWWWSGVVLRPGAGGGRWHPSFFYMTA